MDYYIQPSHISGSVDIPPSKSHTMRAILLASFAEGTSTISHYLPSPDSVAMIAACRQFGAKIEVTDTTLCITGVAGRPRTPEQIIDAGNSGQVLRFVAAFATLCEGYTVLTGDASVRSLRPMQPLLDGLQQLGGFAISTRNNGHAPIVVRGPLQGGTARILGTDSQPVSALLMACSFMSHPTHLHVLEPGEIPWVRLTLDWLAKMGICIEAKSDSEYYIPGQARIAAFDYHVPGDFSSAAFPLIAALITQGDLQLNNLDMSDVQGDKAVISFLQNHGAQIISMADEKKIILKATSTFTGQEIGINDVIDALPILAVLGCFGSQTLHIHGAAIARNKESDRIQSISDELRKMGARISTYEDGLRVEPSQLHGAELHSHHDHRIAMALSVAAFGATGASVIKHCECVEKSYPQFPEAMQQLGADLTVQA